MHKSCSSGLPRATLSDVSFVHTHTSHHGGREPRAHRRAVQVFQPVALAPVAEHSQHQLSACDGPLHKFSVWPMQSGQDALSLPDCEHIAGSRAKGMLF